MRRYVWEVMRLCAKLEIAEPPWFEDESVRERVALQPTEPRCAIARRLEWCLEAEQQPLPGESDSQD